MKTYEKPEVQVTSYEAEQIMLVSGKAQSVFTNGKNAFSYSEIQF